ncbi:Uncharacterised protein [Niallia circulans]|uniref:hypothetical protein n=1 Tax=Shouchella clausii TaxID=79880 RepID=UPI000B97719D|nr:hypothetical protein [Shouchella clausii]SPT78265.1 Uncharacterised protein [Niallia circulans]AST96009.1 hypothetical protein BC8716_08625 [Shouchella clausii]MCM3548416.1 hypothetical protein [Shouchella clausii]MCR1288216.1 hypothetical protein [Shouchella clausii]MEB5474417.1 hypothetical protein [Shouchella clausii]
MDVSIFSLFVIIIVVFLIAFISKQKKIPNKIDMVILLIAGAGILLVSQDYYYLLIIIWIAVFIYFAIKYFIKKQ